MDREILNSLSIIILTLNEEKHIKRCILNALEVADQVFVVDSFSTDNTIAVAKTLGASIVQHEFRNHATQIDWALKNLPIETEWVMRMDADEVISNALVDEIQRELQQASMSLKAFVIPLYVRFQGALIRHGGYPQLQLRIWRKGEATVEQRWMDEKIIVHGDIGRLYSEYTDENLNSVTWWTNKHNNYSTREAIDLLNRKHGVFHTTTNSTHLTRQAFYKRWMKENLYTYMPKGLRAFLFFVYRMVFRLGILDGTKGFYFHFLQCFWYRLLADVKMLEVERRMRKDGIGCVEAIKIEFGIDPLL
ncbi:MAG: glycosyltransferase family 2 protein [Maribacter sp.]|nr:glycosyltransferase family 2 protein [Maribacter sp.]